MKPVAVVAGDSPTNREPRRSDSFPIAVKCGSTVVRIYRTPSQVRGTEYLAYTIAYTSGGVRKRKVLSDLDEAKKEARRLAEQKESGELGVASMSTEDRLRLSDALRELSTLRTPVRPGLTGLVDVIREYSEAANVLPAGARLVEAAKFYAARHADNLAQRTVSEVVNELIEDRRTSGCSEAHLLDLRKRLGRFGVAFQLPIADVTAPMLREYLRNLRSNKGKELTNRSRRNDQRAITSLFHFARSQKYVTREALEDITEIHAPKVEAPEVEIFTTEQLRKVIAITPDDLRAILAIGAFAGLRTAELQRLDWSSVKLAQRVIVLDAGMTKTASRRVVPISDNLAAWLTPLVRASGPVSPSPNDRALNHRLARTAAKAGVVWVRNGLRHGFCSYRLAVTHDPARVAMEAGNSPSMLFRHYRELVTESEGKEWFAISPTSVAGAVDGKDAGPTGGVPPQTKAIEEPEPVPSHRRGTRVAASPSPAVCP